MITVTVNASKISMRILKAVAFGFNAGFQVPKA